MAKPSTAKSDSARATVHQCVAQFFIVLQIITTQHERLPARIMFMKMFVRGKTMRVCRNTGMRMPIKTRLIGKRQRAAERRIANGP